MLEEVTTDWTSADIVELERLLLRLTTDFAMLEESDRA
jgi:hypothetical protein